MRKFARKMLHDIREQAVKDYRRCIVRCLEPAGEPVFLLDCGCDDGAWTVELGRAIGSVRLFGIEIVEERRQIALRRGVCAERADLNCDFPFPDKTFDVIHANQVIEHLTDTDHFVKELKRTLKPGGYAVICTENLSSWHNIFSLVMGWQPFSLSNISGQRFQIGNPLAIHQGESATSPESWQHIRVFAYRGLRELFLVHGFAVEYTEGSGYYPLPGFLSKLDPRHSAFLTLKIRKPVGESSADG